MALLPPSQIKLRCSEDVLKQLQKTVSDLEWALQEESQRFQAQL